GVPPQAVRAAIAAPAMASRVISEVLMPSACAGPGVPEAGEGPLSVHRWSLQQGPADEPERACVPSCHDESRHSAVAAPSRIWPGMMASASLVPTGVPG